ncbi:nucleotidyltransferase domain-containing protein [Microbacterium sp. NPDC058345]|uniref:nucleotidyltransferase domain-containing protein n=1 Tax=Microbacterium sp. NPDC058345 TaxID=3346455 RepID=UPI00364B5F9A
MHFTAVTERFIARHHANAQVALIGGSTARGERTSTSDIDLLLIGDGLFGEDRTSEATTVAFDGEVFEVFAYTEAGFQEWAERDVARRRPVILEMLMDGVVVRDDGSLARLRDRWAPVLASGPVLSDEESALRRYVITDLIDDLRDAVDPLEQAVIAGALFERVSELMLLCEHRWIATGKWLPRRLRMLSRTRTDALAAPLLAGDYARFADRAEDELHRAGGRLQDGFVR